MSLVDTAIEALIAASRSTMTCWPVGTIVNWTGPFRNCILSARRLGVVSGQEVVSAPYQSGICLPKEWPASGIICAIEDFAAPGHVVLALATRSSPDVLAISPFLGYPGLKRWEACWPMLYSPAKLPAPMGNPIWMSASDADDISSVCRAALTGLSLTMKRQKAAAL